MITPKNATYHAVYYVESKGEFVNPIAIEPAIQGKFISWRNTSRGIIIKQSSIQLSPQSLSNSPEALPDKITIQDQQGRNYTLTKMTAAIFNEKVKPLIEGTLHFETDEDVQKFYLNNPNFFSHY